MADGTFRVVHPSKRCAEDRLMDDLRITIVCVHCGELLDTVEVSAQELEGYVAQPILHVGSHHDWACRPDQEANKR